jgi:hypothetical protein
MLLGLLSGLFPSGSSTSILFAFLFFPIHTTFPAQLLLVQVMKILIVQFPQPPVTPSLSDPSTVIQVLSVNVMYM